MLAVFGSRYTVPESTRIPFATEPLTVTAADIGKLPKKTVQVKTGTGFAMFKVDPIVKTILG